MRVKGLRGALQKRDTNYLGWPSEDWWDGGEIGECEGCKDSKRNQFGEAFVKRGRAERPAGRAPEDLIHELQSTPAADRPLSPRMRHPPIMSYAEPPITAVYTRPRSAQQYGLHSCWDQECAGKAKRVAKSDTDKMRPRPQESA